MTAGPVEFLAFSFPLGTDDASIGVTLHSIVESRQLDVIDMVVGQREGNQPAEFSEFAEVGRGFDLGELGKLRTLIAVDDLDAVSAAIGPDRRVVVLVVEHAWHREVTDRVAQMGGRLDVDEWITGEDFAAALVASDTQAKGA